MHYFVDLDGVIIDSARECYEISSKVLYNNIGKSQVYRDKFFKYRGLVLNAREFLILHNVLNNLTSNNDNIEKLFKSTLKEISEKDLIKFEENFFLQRQLMISRDLDYWLSLNPLTQFGKFLVNEKLINLIIITSKNSSSAKLILDYRKIDYIDLFGADEINNLKTKGNLISKYLDNKKINEAIFIDDSVRNLDTCRDSRVKCFFADWGYGKNSDYENYLF
tara:strand:- start:126 stop:788 length:663 start_codon:yes stop_codon:yes gene_type:complete